MRKKKITDFLKKQWIIVWLIVASLALVTFISFAAYKDANNKMKRVVAPAASTDGLFTSNYLALGQSNVKPAYFQSNDAPYKYDVIIRNYNPVDPNNVYNGTITYTLSIELVKSNENSYDTLNAEDAAKLTALGSGNIEVALGSETFTLDATHLTHTFPSQTLTKTDGTDTWQVTYNDIELDSDYCVKFIAHADNADLEDIYATVIVASYPAVRPQGWNCVLDEAGENMAAYDGFNYTISGTGAKTLKFSYDSSKLAVNPACYQLDANNDVADPATYSGNGSHDSNWKTIVINANPDTTFVNRYDIQMYKIGSYSPSSSDEIDPNKAGAYVEFE